MKNVYFLLLFFVQALFLQAANISIDIKNIAFNPTAVNVSVGDVITWTNSETSTAHTVTSTAVPTGASAFDSGNMNAGTTFQYTVTVAGSYSYHCTYHSNMVATFTASAATTTPIAKPTLTLNALYPNPAVETVHIESPKIIKSIDIYSETGTFIKTVSFSSDKIDLQVADLQKGAYLLRVTSEDGMFDTRRIVKM